MFLPSRWLVAVGLACPFASSLSATVTTTPTLPGGPSSRGASPAAPIGFYVHIPYCRRRCRYCSFAIVPVGTGAAGGSSRSGAPASASFEKIHSAYQEDLFAELDVLLRTERGEPDSPHTKIPLASVYFGGGTPSLAPFETIAGVLERISGDASPFRLLDDAEVTMEMDPGTFTTEDLAAWKNLGINRVSLGVQSFDDAILEALGRCHRSTDIQRAVQSIGSVFGETANYSIDLISGVPGLSAAMWIETLEHATSFLDPPPSHLSIYDLQIEEGTVFSAWYSDDARGDAGNSSSSKHGDEEENTTPKRWNRSRVIPSLPSEESVAAMYKFGAGYLRSKGFEHYEVSSYARIPATASGDPAAVRSNRSRHNQIYWEPLGSWYAIGLGATSMVRQRTTARPRTLAEYHDWVAEQQTATPNEDGGTEVLEDDFLTDVIMKRLRTADGLDLGWIEDRFGADTRQSVVDGASLGLELGLAELLPSPSSSANSDGSSVSLTQSTNTRLRLKDPEGFLYSNYLISSIFAELGYE